MQGSQVAVDSIYKEERERIKSVVHLRNLIDADRSIRGLPLVSLWKTPLSVTVPIPVQL